MPKLRISPAERARVLAMLADGVPASRVASAVGRPRQTIYRIAAANDPARVPSDAGPSPRCEPVSSTAAAAAASAAARRERGVLRPPGITAEAFSDGWWVQCDRRFRDAMRCVGEPAEVQRAM